MFIEIPQRAFIFYTGGILIVGKLSPPGHVYFHLAESTDV